ncbi:3'(2'),5'-bisphosphate nucleotidase CysQ [Nitratireductor sp. ZSWI3]|uniref:3'(2'),5'-bisphosphate nucleotidase CysQ n=1 Tax=Nitratireductor sp. ZSWI3 TaxID=2966359 RepID=UPI0021506409|nr:3'(2'),5'-bisphosphate nucleotidase CysQ [Nitratireductor sp. ZSWI3]MCR4269025.1 3'(2'),5'-bisphosphate nucleotidase CysQ [Nitratireductor sp. ZSWI3]
MPESDKALHAHAEDLSLITGVAREAGRIALKYFRRDPEVWWKGGTSPVSEADLAVDRFLREALLAARPAYGWLSEETAAAPERLSASRVFIVDPIDGTRAFIGGRPTWCISIAVVEEGRTIAGVLDCPAVEEVYTAARGDGAFANGTRISVKKPAADVVIAGPKSMLSKLPADLFQRTRPHGYVPSLAYRIAMVARGTLDATFVKPNAHDWDIAAADLLLHEAGGAILNASGVAPQYGGADPRHRALVAGSQPLLRKLAAVVADLESREAGGRSL